MYQLFNITMRNIFYHLLFKVIKIIINIGKFFSIVKSINQNKLY